MKELAIISRRRNGGLAIADQQPQIVVDNIASGTVNSAIRQIEVSI
jgi:hypothetical protein